MEATPSGALHPITLRFLDEDLEWGYQTSEGRRALTGFRLTAGAAAVIWALAGVLVPLGTGLDAAVATPISLLMAAVSAACAAAGRWAQTLDRQHALLAVLTSGNGLVILWLAWLADAVPGYAVSAVMLLLAYGFVSRTGFVWAVMRSLFITAGFVVVVVRYRGPESLVIDAFVYVAAVLGTLLALRRLERDRRRVFHQQLVIEEQSADLAQEKEKSDRLLSNILPAPVTARLREGEAMIADDYPSVSVLFADIVGFTPIASRLPALALVNLLGGLFSAFDELVAGRGLEKIKTIGDAYMVAGGLDGGGNHADRVVDLGLEMIPAAARFAVDGAPLVVRVGVHTGPAVGGVIGTRTFAFDLWGDTVNIASRLERQGVAGRVHISTATRELVGDHFACEPRGSIELRGHGAMQTFLIVGRRPVAAEPTV